MESKYENERDSEGQFLECPSDLLTAFADNMAVVNLESESKDKETRLKGGVDTLHLSLVVTFD